MKTYLLLSAGAVFLTVLVGFIVPEGKLNKCINFVLRLACILILVSPVVKLFDPDITSTQSELVDYDYICSVYSKSQSEQLEILIYDNLGVECDCTIDFSYEDGHYTENGVKVLTECVDEGTIGQIEAYLRDLGYININVDEKNT